MRLTKHAIERALDMALDGEEIREAFRQPEQRHWSHKHQTWLLTKGRVTLSVGSKPEELDLIITILWATAEDWQRDYEFPVVKGRQRRTDLSHLPK